MRIWANTLVKNEDRFIWFAVMSVIEHVDKMLVWDTGSTDKTVAIINNLKKLYPQKIDFREVCDVTISEFAQVREEMLNKTNADWLILVDGDEVWWEERIKEVTKLITEKGFENETIVSRYINPVGDIFHYQEEKAGKYKIDNISGHLTIRAMSTKIPGLTVINPHPLDAYVDKSGIPVQERDRRKRFHLRKPCYLHLTHLLRSSSLEQNVPKRKLKLKYEIGNSFALDFYYPEVFFRPRPKIVPNPWVKMDSTFFARAFLETPIKKLKRKFL